MFMKPKFGLHVKLSYVNDYLKIFGMIWHMLIAWKLLNTISKYNACDVFGFVYANVIYDFCMHGMVFNDYGKGIYEFFIYGKVFYVFWSIWKDFISIFKTSKKEKVKTWRLSFYKNCFDQTFLNLLFSLFYMEICVI